MNEKVDWFKWIVSGLLTVICFFMVRLVGQVDKISEIDSRVKVVESAVHDTMSDIKSDIRDIRQDIKEIYKK